MRLEFVRFLKFLPFIKGIKDEKYRVGVISDRIGNNEVFKRKFTYACMTVRFMIILGCSLQSAFKNGYCKIEQGRVNFTL